MDDITDDAQYGAEAVRRLREELQKALQKAEEWKRAYVFLAIRFI